MLPLGMLILAAIAALSVLGYRSTERRIDERPRDLRRAEDAAPRQAHSTGLTWPMGF